MWDKVVRRVAVPMVMALLEHMRATPQLTRSLTLTLTLLFTLIPTVTLPIALALILKHALTHLLTHLLTSITTTLNATPLDLGTVSSLAIGPRKYQHNTVLKS